MNKQFTATLSVNDIKRMKSNLVEYKNQLKNKDMEITAKLAGLAKIYIRENLISEDAVESGALYASIITEPLRNGYAVLPAPHMQKIAQFVEFGTGVTGMGQPHERYKEFGWQYDVNKHGELGWIYFNERTQQYVRTTGMPARPFMWRAFLQLTREAKKVAVEVLNK